MPASANRLHGLSPFAIQRVIACAQALESGRAEQAAAHLAGVLTAYPRQPEVLRLQAGILELRGDHVRAIEVMRTALSLRPGDPLYHNTLGSMLGAVGEFDAAIDALRRACDLQPNLGIAWYNLGVMLTRCVRHAEAIAALRRAVEIDHSNLHARCLLADMLRVEGQLSDAEAEYRRVLSEQPWFGLAWWGLADLKTVPFRNEDVTRMQVALSTAAASQDDRITTGFALARALDDAGRYSDGFRALQQAHAIARQHQIWDAPAFSNQVDAMIEAACLLPRGITDETMGREVTFIVGLPRSGTTLVEQILSSHSQVEGAGELPDLPLVLNEESRRRRQRFPTWCTDADYRDWIRLGKRYLERTATWRRRKPRFTDKLPTNWLYIGAIRAMLPGARIIICRRDPLETCFSCYRQFMQNNEYTHSFTDLAAYWHDFDRSVRHWQGRSDTHCFQFAHEALLADSAAAIRQLLEFCGLSFEASCIDFHATPRAIHSPSASQVRQPLRRDTAHAEHYGHLLDPLREALKSSGFAGK